MQNTKSKWSEAKAQINTEYPEIYPNTIEYYKLAMDVYKELTKCASADDLMRSLYQEGSISKEATLKYERNKIDSKVYNKVLNKEGSIWDSLKKNTKGLGDELTRGAIRGAAAALGAGVLYGGAKGISYLSNKINRGRRLENIYKFNPTLRHADKSLINTALNDIERLNPTIAKSPLITGKALKDIITQEGFGPEQAKLIADIKDGGQGISRHILKAGSSATSEIFKNLKKDVSKSKRFKKTSSDDVKISSAIDLFS